jgi:uncharacterized membrane protein
VAAGTAGLFATIVVATQHYELVPPAAGLVAAAATAAAATVLAVRWVAPGIGALGLGGALLAPALAGAGPEDGGLAFLVVAAAAAVGVLLHQRWTWLALLSFTLATPQWLLGLRDEPAGVVLAVAALFGVLNVAGAIGHDVRHPAGRMRIAAHALLALNALVVAGAGVALASLEAPALWLAALALAHLGAAAAIGAARRASREVALVLAALGVILGDVAFAAVVDGTGLVAGWALAAVGFAGLLRAARDAPRVVGPSGAGRHAADALVARLGLGGHLALAIGSALDTRAAEGSAAVPLLVVAAGCLVSARLARDGRAPWRAVLDGIGIATVALVLADAFDGPALTLALALEAVAVAAVAAGSRRPRRPGAAPRTAAPAEPDPVGMAGALALLAIAASHALATSAPPSGLVDALADLRAAAAALVTVALAGAVVAERGGHAALRSAGVPAGAVGSTLQAVAIAAVLHLGSLLVVAVSPADAAQLSLSALWAIVGVALLLAGLRLDARGLRRGALGLLAVTAGKVFLYDLASLESIYRVLSFIALGVLLLGAAHAWQRVRPGLTGEPGGRRPGP